MGQGDPQRLSPQRRRMERSAKKERALGLEFNAGSERLASVLIGKLSRLHFDFIRAAGGQFN